MKAIGRQLAECQIACYNSFHRLSGMKGVSQATRARWERADEITRCSLRSDVPTGGSGAGVRTKR